MVTVTPTSTGPLDDGLRAVLLEVARNSIVHGIEYGSPVSVDTKDFAPALGVERATFVTLHRLGSLRGCIGHLEAIQPLVVDVAENAYSAAFRDPRFEPLRRDERVDLSLHISVLSEPAPMSFSSEQDLIRQLRPGVDGLILRDGSHRGTFLPSVWESLPRPEDFLAQLKRKAGLPEYHWGPSVEVFRYETESFP